MPRHLFFKGPSPVAGSLFLALSLIACGSNDDDGTGGAALSGWDSCSFVAVGYDSTVACTDGTSWTSKELTIVDENLVSVAAGADGNLVAVGQQGAVLHSPDFGVSWSLAHTLPDEVLTSVVWDGSRFVVGVNPAIVSNDGATWTTAGKLEPGTAEVSVASIAAVGPGTSIAVGKAFLDLSSQDHVYLTDDGGETWSAVWTGNQAGLGSGLEVGFTDVTTDGETRAVAVGRNGLVVTAAGPSFATWSEGAGVPEDANLFAVAYDAKAERFVAGELEGAFYVSDDGLTWTAGCDEAASLSIADITIREGMMIAVGPGTTVVSSNGADQCAAQASSLLLFGVTPVR